MNFSLLLYHVMFALGSSIALLIFVLIAWRVSIKSTKRAYILFFIGIAIQVLSVLGNLKRLQLSYYAPNYGDLKQQLFDQILGSIIITIVGYFAISRAKNKTVELYYTDNEMEESQADEGDPLEMCYSCRNCGAFFSAWYKDCPNCHAVDTIEYAPGIEIVSQEGKKNNPSEMDVSPQQSASIAAVPDKQAEKIAEELNPTLFCRKCGARIPADSTFCPRCGEKVISV